MPNCFETKKVNYSIPINILTKDTFSLWLKSQSSFIKNWFHSLKFNPLTTNLNLVPDETGKLSQVLFLLDVSNPWAIGSLPLVLPENYYYFQLNEDSFDLGLMTMAWGLGAYQFSRYKKPIRNPARLVLSKKLDAKKIINIMASIYWVRDLINTPTEDLGPSELGKIALQFSKKYKTKIKQIIGKDLLTHHYPAIHLVGRASNDPPRLIDIRWGNKKHFKLSLIGKGVCFDSGGLDIKTSPGMLLMKKDMAGAAHVLGLARMIIEAQLPIYLRVLIPAVENVISGNAYRPGDVVRSRQGLTIEIGNTDAEGRVILADALTEAASENPDLMIDMTTLTGAARIALGTEVPVFFTNNDILCQALKNHALKTDDPIWQLPLFANYRESLNSSIADINNTSVDGHGGAITAGLFLKEFIPDHIPWVHFDMMAWNLKSRPSKPQGGEAMGLRALYSYIEEIT